MASAALYTGPCLGGPMDKLTGESRYPKGFLLIDNAQGYAWIYDWNGQSFVCREPWPRTADFDKRWAAAEGDDWDVRAA